MRRDREEPAVKREIGSGRGRASPRRSPSRPAPQGRPRTASPMPPALEAFLRELGDMAADTILQNLRGMKGLVGATIECPGANDRGEPVPGAGETGGRFVHSSMRPACEGDGFDDQAEATPRPREAERRRPAGAERPVGQSAPLQAAVGGVLATTALSHSEGGPRGDVGRAMPEAREPSGWAGEGRERA